jgi:hypothetical protein
MSDATAPYNKLALRLANVEHTIACAGTTIEQSSFKVGGKSFLFVQAKHGGVILRMKLGDSFPAASALAEKQPTTVEAGIGGWVTIRLAAGEKAPAGLPGWVKESHAVQAGGVEKKTAKKKTAKKKTAKKKKT